MGTKALEEYVNGLPGGDYDAVNQSVRRGFQRNPDAYAKSLDLAKKTGVAPELQEGMEQDIDLEARVGQVPIQKIVQSHPALAKHLKDDGFATLAQNDLRSLLGLSAAVQAIPEMKPWNPTFADKTKDFFRGLMEGTTFSTPEEAQAIRQAESARILTAAHMGVNPAEMHTGNAATLPASRIGAGLLRGALRPLSGAVRYAERKTGIDTGIGANLQGGVEALTPASPTTADTSVESFGSTLGLLVPGLGMQKAVGAISKVRALAKVPALLRQAGQWAGAVAMALPEAASEAQDVYDELKAKGSTDQEASSMSDRTFWGNAAMLAVTDKIGWFSGEGLTRRVVAEAAQEGTQTGMSNAATGKPILENVPESALMGGATAGVMHVGGKFVSGLLGKQTTGAIDFSEKVQDTQEFLADLSEGVKASKIAETSPDRVQAFVQDAAKDGQENLLIPADRYFQTVTDAGLDPAELAQSLGVVNLQEAMEAGTDVVIPVGAYAAQIAATDLHGKLAQDIRLNPGDATMREEQEAGKLAEDEAAKTTEDAQSIQVQAEIDALPTSSELDKYRESVKQAMIGGNIPADQAADLAETWIQPARVFIEQGDITAEQAAQMWPLTVTAYRKGEGKKSIAQIALDRLKAMSAGIKEYAQSVVGGKNVGMEPREQFVKDEILKANAAGIRHRESGTYWNYYSPVLQAAYDHGQKGINLSAQPDFAGKRYGKAPEGGVSRNYTDERSEGGLSLAVKPDGNPVGSSVWFTERKKHDYQGLLLPFTGSDGEALILPYSEDISNDVPSFKTFFQRGGGRYASSAEKRSARAKRAGQNTQASMDKAKMDAHNADEDEFAAFNAAVDEVQAGDILDDRRGFIQFGNQQIQIGLLEGRNLSTILHETSHAFLEMLADVAEMPTASERTKTLWADTLKELGIESRAQIKTKQHEQFASWGERYFMEGKAPSEKMRPLMQRFQSWMQMVYKTLEKLGVRINDDVRSVFDRLMATDAEIEAHKPTFETFATAEAMGVSQAEFDIYKKAQAGAIQEGHDRLQVEVMGDLLREQKAAYKAEKAVARAEVEAGVDSRPDMKAIAALTDPANEIKLNRQAVQDQFGDARGLPVVEEGGMDAEAAAEMLGFDSGAQLYQALKDAPARADLIDTLTDEIMFSRYGDVTLDGSIADKAVEAIHTDKMADVLAMELRAMSRLKRIAEKVGKAKDAQDKAAQKAADVQVPGVSTFREQARNMISGMTLRQMEPHKYELAELKYRKEADKLTKKKDYEGAVKAKTREMLNHFLYREAKKGQEEAGKIYDYARSLEGNTAQGKLGKAGRVFQDQVNALLDRYQFAKETLKALDARQTLLEFVREQEANGEAVMIDPAILNEARRINYREVPMSELRAVRDALKNIQTIAYRQLDMDIDGKHVAKDEAKTEMIASALLNFKAKPLPFSGSDLTVKESASKWLKGKSAMFTKMERVIDWLDGGKIDGPWRSYIFNRIAKAEIAEFDLNTAVTQKFIEAFEKMDPKHWLSMTDSVGVTLPGMDRPLNRRQAITLLMNMGNDQNQEKLLEGYGWTSPQAIGMVGDALGNLTTGDLEFVNTTWKTINALWPAIEDLEFKMTGISPEKVDARPFTVTLKDGSQHMMDGGYFPIVYDPSRSPQGAKQIEGNVNELTDKGFSRPNTPHGFTKSRVQFSAPILLNFEHTLTRHLSQVIKDVTHREAVTDIYSLITSQDIRDALNETIGEAQQKQFLPWLKSVVNDRNGAGTQGLEEFSGGIMAVRSNLITATLAFRLSSVIVQATDLVRAMDRVKPRFMAEAFASFTAAQRIGHNELVDEMREKSGEMRHRPQSFDRDMRVVLQKGFGDQPIKKRVAEFGAHGLSYADAITSTITWVGAYRQALAAGSSETEAIAEADRTVRLVLQAGSPKDLTPIQKGGALEKLLTMYAGDSFATYGIMQDAAQQIKGAKDAPKWAARMLFAVLMPAIIADLIKGRVPDDDEDKAKWLAWKAATALPNTLPILRDISSSMESGYDYKFTPVAEAIAKAGRALQSAVKVAEGEKDPVDVLFQGIDAAGTLWGVPGTSQAMQTSKYLYKVSQGEENPDNAAQLVKNAILGKPKK